MATVLTFDEITEKSQNAYQDLEIPLRNGECVTLRHPLRLDEDERAELVAFVSTAEESEDADVEEEKSPEEKASALEQVQDLIRLLADGTGVDELFSMLGTDQTKYSVVVTTYFEATQAGEA